MRQKSLILGITLLFFVLLAGMAKGFSDTLQFHYNQSIFNSADYKQSYFNPELSWKNKYQNNDISRPAFFGSTTFLVWTTDAWHLAQMIEFMSWFMALLLALRLGNGQRQFIIGSAIVLYLVFHAGFWLTYNWLLILK